MAGILTLLIGICALAFGINAEISIEGLRDNLAQVGRQLVLQQLFVEERIRSDGDSGIKIIRLNNVGPRPYYGEGFSSDKKYKQLVHELRLNKGYEQEIYWFRLVLFLKFLETGISSHKHMQMVASVHNHDNNVRTIGMGEFIAVLNGVEFRTRHNDYRLYMPNTTSDAYHSTEDIPFPDVPPEVLQHTDVPDQIDEMREWFRAFKDQNITHRDYRPYFRPILCYLEGAWTTSTDKLEESFHSDRHITEAETWHDLQEKIRFTSYTGRKNILENFSYLPTTIIDFINGTIPVMAQWNYRLLCHPLNNSLPTNRLRVVDDLVTRMRDRTDFYEFSMSRAARFQLNPVDSDEWTLDTPRKQFLDELMGEIPGVDNYGGYIVDNTTEATAYDVDGKEGGPLNVAYYNRVFKVDTKDAMGLDIRRRGFNDQNVFMAATTNPKIAPMSAVFCRGKKEKNKKCNKYTERWTYAIPLEIIYLTPLSTWNPYNLQFKGEHNSPEGKTVTANGRNGNDKDRAWNGINSKTYYMTPAQFYSGEDVGENDPADTSTGAKWALDPKDVAHRVSSSGVRILMHSIPGVGTLRQRYPIMPLHDDGNVVYKELEALKDIVLEPEKYAHMLRGKQITNLEKGLDLTTGSSSARTGSHVHFIHLTAQDVRKLYADEAVTKETTEAHQHIHRLTIIQKKEKPDNTIYYKYTQCDDEASGEKCGDGHPFRLNIQP